MVLHSPQILARKEKAATTTTTTTTTTTIKFLLQLLDELSYTTRAASCPQPRLAAVAQRLYNRFGKEITNVMALKDDQEVWVSYGEPFISPISKSRRRGRECSFVITVSGSCLLQ